MPLIRRVVLANGTTRLQIDITKSSGLQFDTLLSSELLGITKVGVVYPRFKHVNRLTTSARSQNVQKSHVSIETQAGRMSYGSRSCIRLACCARSVSSALQI